MVDREDSRESQSPWKKNGELIRARQFLGEQFQRVDKRKRIRGDGVICRFHCGIPDHYKIVIIGKLNFLGRPPGSHPMKKEM